ncbi:TPA: hypothetical protein HA361_03570 [Candidatus Woesearchaeota archaeon]|nr:hypothetical protein [Candidatus Woesearchaeota archaeon]HII68838.1 hypothetical protein [Candidatus Woesearchaeota archaeon]
MNISELQAKQGNVEVVADVVEKGEVRTWEKFGKEGRVCSAKIRDDSGTVVLSLWNEQAEKVNVGDRVKVTNGYVSEFRGDMQLSTGKFGKLEVVGKAGDEAPQEHDAPSFSEDSEEPIRSNVPEPEQRQDPAREPDDMGADEPYDPDDEDAPIKDEEYIG